MKDTTSAALFSLVCFVIITGGFLFFAFGIVQFFILLIGVTAILFQKLIHRQPIRELGFRWTQWSWIFYSVIFPLFILLIVVGIDVVIGWVHLRPFSEMESVMGVTTKRITAMTLLLSILTHGLWNALEYTFWDWVTNQDYLSVLIGSCLIRRRE